MKVLIPIFLAASTTVSLAWAKSDLERAAHAVGRAANDLLAGPKRPGDQERASATKEDRAAEMDRYINWFSQQVEVLNSQRREALEITNLSSRLSALANKVETECSGSISTVKQADACVAQLGQIFTDTDALREKSAQLSYSFDPEIQMAGRVNLVQLDSFRSKLTGVLELWVENKYRLISAGLKDSAKAAGEKGRERADCAAGPLNVRNTLSKIDSDYRSALLNHDPYPIYSGLERIEPLTEQVAKLKAACPGGTAELTASIEGLHTLLSQAPRSERVISWYRARCATALRNGLDVECPDSPSTAILYTLSHVKAEGVR